MKEIVTLPTMVPGHIDPEALLMKAVETGQSVDTIERLLALREHLQAEFAAMRYRQSLLAFQQECPKIKKDMKVKDKDGTERYRYATLEGILDVARPILHSHGFSFDFDSVCEAGAVTVIMTISHTAGHERQSRFRVPIDPKAFMTEPQRYEAAMSFAQRITFRNGFGILTGIHDDNTEEEHQPVTQRQVTEPQIGADSPQHKALEARIQELGLNRDSVKKLAAHWFGTGHFPEMTRKQFHTLMDELPRRALTKLEKQIPLLSAPELEALIKTPPPWLSDVQREALLLKCDEQLSQIAADLAAAEAGEAANG